VSNRWLVAAGAGLILAALTPLGGAQARGSSWWPDISPTWRTVDQALVDLQDRPGTNNRLILGVFRLRGDTAGEKAYLVVRWRERRYSTARAAMCAGLRYARRHVIDTRVKAGEGWFGLVDHDARAHLTITHRIAIYETSTLIGPPICVQATGKWEGTGPLFGAGTFVFNNDDTLTFR
jgi:hypothetical protein